MRSGEVSFWYAELGGLPSRRPALPGDLTADVCIIGAGFTGLWSAYYLLRHRPDLKVVILEREFAGFGASGRNGGWLTGGFAWRHDRYLRQGEEAVRRLVRAMRGTVDEVARVCAAEGIDAGITRTDELTVATSPPQVARMEAEIAERRHWGEAPGEVDAISAAEMRARIAVPQALAAMRVTGVARVQPARLVRGLAATVERLGAVIHEGTTVTAIAPACVTTDRGTVRAPIVLRATEGFTAGLPGHRRDLLPLNSAQIVTEPLPPALWQEIGWGGNELFGDMRNAYCYCQRTADGRIAVGARGVPYRFGSSLDTLGAPDAATVAALRDVLARHFPAVSARVPLAHAWCGVLGVPRDWAARVGFDRATGLGWAGGYVGVGVSTSNLAGQTLADLALGRATDLTALPWVNLPVRRWEPEPLRWLGVRGMYRALAAADRHEDRTGRPAGALSRLIKTAMGR